MIPLAEGCFFDRSGLDPARTADAGTPASEGPVLLEVAGGDVFLLNDQLPPDLPSDADGAPLVDADTNTLAPDTLPPDTQPPDLGGYRPVTTSEIVAAWLAVKVPCIDQNGTTAGPDIDIIDTGSITLVDGAVTLQGAPADTKAWVGSLPSVTVVFDPNACGLEDPAVGDNSWGTAGLIIRGATIDGQGRLVLQPGVTVNDIDLTDVSGGGSFEGSKDFAKPDDSELVLHPQIVQPINAAKSKILEVASS